MLRSALRATLAASLLFSPVIVSAQAAPPVAAVPAPDIVDEGSSQLAGDYGPLLAIGILAVVIGLAYVLSNDDGPDSP